MRSSKELLRRQRPVRVSWGVGIFSSRTLGPTLLVESLIELSPAELDAHYLGVMLLIVRVPGDDEPGFQSALEKSVLRQGPPSARSSISPFVTAEIPTLRVPKDEPTDTDQAEMLAELSAAEHVIVPLLARDPGRTLIVGRAVNSDVLLVDSSVSARHAELSVQDGGVRLRDLSSKNGTILNGTTLRPEERAWLQPMDRLRFGRVETFACDPRALRAVLRQDLRTLI